MSNLLLDKRPLVLLPELAIMIGLNESIVLQQIHYWIDHKKELKQNFIDGNYWVYNTYAEWQKQFPFWSTRTIKSIFSKLENSGLLISRNYNSLKIDRTKWYTIDYGELAIVQKLHDQSAEFALPLPETTTETTNTNTIEFFSQKTTPVIRTERCNMNKTSTQIRSEKTDPSCKNIRKKKECYKSRSEMLRVFDNKYSKLCAGIFWDRLQEKNGMNHCVLLAEQIDTANALLLVLSKLYSYGKYGDNIELLLSCTIDGYLETERRVYTMQNYLENYLPGRLLKEGILDSSDLYDCDGCMDLDSFIQNNTRHF